jgi:hypothetical protein
LKKAILAFVFLLLFAVNAYGQSTTITGTVTDSAGQNFNNGAYTISFYGNGTIGPYFHAGSPFNPNTSFSGALTGSGAFPASVVIPSSNSITPAGTLWTFKVCPAASGNCYSSNISVLGSTLNVTSQITPPAITVSASAFNQPNAYQDSEITGAVVGFTYFNLTDNTLHVCTVQIPCSWVSVSGGIAGNPAAPALAMQVANGGVNGFATATCGSNGTIGVDAVGSSATTLVVPCNMSVAGPRPRVDVTAPPFNAKGNGSTDDTAAIQAAINQACLSASSGGGGDIYFPPGDYPVTQTQLPSTAPVFSVPCSFLHFVGGNMSPTIGHAAFAHAPQILIFVHTLGASPNNAPIFGIGTGYQGTSQPNFGITFENMTIEGYNQGLAIWNAIGTTLRNTCVADFNTGGTDNTPLKISNDFQFFMYDGCLDAVGGPVMLWTTETPVSSEEPVFSIFYIHGTTMTGSEGIHAIQRVSTGGPVLGDFDISDVLMENANDNFLTLSNTSGSAMQLTAIRMSHVQMADASGPGSIIYLNAASSSDGIYGANLDHVAALPGGAAITIAGGGFINSYSVDSCIFFCFNQVVDSSGNPIGTGNVQSQQGGMNFISQFPTTGGASGPFSQPYTTTGGFSGSRWIKAGGSNATVAADGQFGFLFNDGNQFGFDVGLQQSNYNTLDVKFSSMLPPTGLAGTAASGGSIANGTYYLYASATSDNCTTQSVSSLASSAVTLSGSNGTINATWALPATTPITPSGYCIGVSTSSLTPPTSGALFVTGSSSTSVSLTAIPGGGHSMLQYSVLTPVHRFTENALGIGTTSPAANSITLNVGGFNGIFTHSNSASRTYTFPNITGTVGVVTGSTPVNNDCPEFSVSGGVFSLIDSGSICGGGSGNISGPGSATTANDIMAWTDTSGTKAFDPGIQYTALGLCGLDLTCTAPALAEVTGLHLTVGFANGGTADTSSPTQVGQYICAQSGLTTSGWCTPESPFNTETTSYSLATPLDLTAFDFINGAITVTLPNSGSNPSLPSGFVSSFFNNNATSTTFSTSATLNGTTTGPQYWLGMLHTSSSAYDLRWYPSFKAFGSTCTTALLFSTTATNPFSCSTTAVTNNGTNLTANGAMYATGAESAASTAALTNGQVLIGDTSTTPAAATLTAGSGVTITNGPGSITIAASGATSGTICSSTSTSDQVTTQNTAFATTCSISSGVMGSLVAGNVIEVYAAGSYTTTATSAPKINLDVNLLEGATTYNECTQATSLTLSVSQASNTGAWDLSCKIVIVTTGSSGTMIQSGYEEEWNAAGSVNNRAPYASNNATSTINTSGANTLSIEEVAAPVSGQTYNLTTLLVTEH